MKPIAFIFILCLFLCSCATILNSKTTRIDVITNQPTTLVFNYDTIIESVNSRLRVIRSDRPVTFELIPDSSFRLITLLPRNSFAYWFNIYCNLGVGMIVDKNYNKHYSYYRRIYIDLIEDSNDFYRYNPFCNDKEIYLHFSLPWINNFYLKPDGEINGHFNTGFWGFSLGLDYYYQPYRFFSAKINAVESFFLPFPAAVDISGEFEISSSIYLDISHNYKINRFLLGYGINYSWNRWMFGYSDFGNPPPPTRDPVIKSHNTIGINFSSYSQIGELYYLGIIYRPTFFALTSPHPIQYEHLISIDFGWKFRLRD